MSIVEIPTVRIPTEDGEHTCSIMTFDVTTEAKDQFKAICKSKGLSMNKALRHMLYDVLSGNIALKHLIDN